MKFPGGGGGSLGEYLARVLSYRATLAEPKDLAWLLASYARDALSRLEAADAPPELDAIRSALEDALGVHFEGEKGARFFHSTLVQTLFYGIFSAWVLWARQLPPPAGGDKFDWRTAVWHLRAPVIRALYQQLSGPGRLGPLGLVDVLDWASAALDRVDRDAFFTRFNEGEAVQYFYEPFLAAFDPALREEFGVWYTPPEVVRYMVARVDKALKDDLSIADGLAADNVYVLDPCCGTGAYLAEVLRRISENLQGQGVGALAGARVRDAALKRVFGFEIMPAPFVVAHLQVGLTLRDLDAPLAEDETERAQVFLTNALTGWDPDAAPKQRILFSELEDERDRAEKVKQDKPILVILGNPPYNGFADMAVDDERKLSQAYRDVKEVRPPEGKGLNDLYVRFFRMAERRIVEKTGQGVICFISNYLWLDGLSLTGMRERYLEVFDAVRIDCLNGDIRKGARTPEGKPDASIFTTKDGPGILVGTAIATLVRKVEHRPAGTVSFRHLWGQSKPAELTATAEAEPEALYQDIEPVLKLGLPFVPTMVVSNDWFDWPSLPELFPKLFPGIKTSRDGLLVDIDLDRLKARVEDYFDSTLSHDEIARRYPGIMKSTAQFDARATRAEFQKRVGPDEAGFILFAYRPFDERWLYWEGEGGLLDRPRPEYKPHVFEGNLWLVSQQKHRREWSPPQVASSIACLDLMDRGASVFPMRLRRDLSEGSAAGQRHDANLSESARRYLERLGASVEDMFHHVLSTLHDPAYFETNAEALSMDWPRIPLPGWPEGDAAGATEAFRESAARGREIAQLLDSKTPVPGVTKNPQPAFAAIAAPSTKHGRNMSGDDFAVTAGWGRLGSGCTVMPGRGQTVERNYTPQERAALNDDALSVLGKTTFDIYLNGDAFWCNVPAAVWNYKLGGYQVLKKWLSYREHKVLDRPLHLEEVQHFTNTARRIAALLLQEFKK